MPDVTNNLVNYCTNFGSGSSGTPATGPEYYIRLYVDGSWSDYDEITLTVVYNDVRYDLGIKEPTRANITFAASFKNQVMLCADDRVYFSGLNSAIAFEERHAGYGFITTSGERGEALEALAVVPYAGKLAVFARNNVQLWLPNADPAQWTLVQSLENTGTCSPKSVVSYGELDVFFLSDSGVRSLRAREFTDLVNVQDVGTNIDDILRAELDDLSDELKRSSVFGYYSTRDGRYMLYIAGRFYAFSYFSGNRVSAWTRFGSEAYHNVYGQAVPLIPQYATVSDGYLYMLDMAEYMLAVYPYSSAGYHETATIVIPFFDAKQPATKKKFTGIDLVGSGTWKVEVGDNPNNEASFITLSAAIALSTVNLNRIPLSFCSTHIIVKLTHVAEEEAVLSRCILHYTLAGAK